MSLTCLARCLKYSKCSLSGLCCSWWWNEECEYFDWSRMDVCLQYWIRWMRALERKSGGYRKGWLKWWVLGTMLHHKLKEKWLLDCQKKERVFMNTSWIWYIPASWKSITLPGPPPAFSFLKHLFGLYWPHLSALPQHKNICIWHHWPMIYLVISYIPALCFLNLTLGPNN